MSTRNVDLHDNAFLDPETWATVGAPVWAKATFGGSSYSIDLRPGERPAAGAVIRKLKVFALKVSELPDEADLQDVIEPFDRLKSRVRVNVELLMDAVELRREFVAAIDDRDAYREEARGLLQRLDASHDSEARIQQQLSDYRQFTLQLLQGFGLKANVPSPTASREQLQAYLAELARLIQAQRQPVPAAQPAERTEWPTDLMSKEVGRIRLGGGEDVETPAAVPEKKGLKPCSDPHCPHCLEQQ